MTTTTPTQLRIDDDHDDDEEEEEVTVTHATMTMIPENLRRSQKMKYLTAGEHSTRVYKEQL